MAGRVARAVTHLQFHPAEAHGIAAGEPAPWREGLQLPETETRALLRQVVDQEPVIDMRTFDRQAELFRQLRRPAAVVDVAMGEQDFLQHHALLLHRIKYQLQVSAWIDHRGFVRLFAHQERAVLLERGDRNDGDFHSTSK